MHLWISIKKWLKKKLEFMIRWIKLKIKLDNKDKLDNKLKYKMFLLMFWKMINYIIIVMEASKLEKALLKIS